MNFGGLELKYAQHEHSHFVIVPVPYDLTSTYQSGSRRGPSAILDASSNMELYDEELQKEVFLAGIHTMDPLHVDARGPREMIKAVERITSEILQTGKIPVILGGEHSISFGAVQAMKKKYPDLKVVQFDAHADMRMDYQGSPFSHASVARRISEICPLVQIGIRSMSVEEADYLKKSKSHTFTAERVHDDPDVVKKISKLLKGNVYLTLDLDVLDPSIMPSTGTPEPGGLLWREILKLLRAISKSCKIRGFDVVELAPIPGMVAPDFLAARLIYRMMGYLTEEKNSLTSNGGCSKQNASKKDL